MSTNIQYPKVLSSESKAKYLFFSLRWKDKTPTCLICESSQLWKLADGRYQCKQCNQNKARFSDFSSTYLDYLHLSYRKAGQLVYLFALDKSSHESSNILGLKDRQVYNFYTRIRKAIRSASITAVHWRKKKDEIGDVLLSALKKLEENHHGVSLARLSSYIDEFAFKYVNRGLTPNQLFQLICTLLAKTRR